jgi:uncharacterized protein with NRDE domain
MCLIAIAHRVSEQWPLLIAANRDELYDRAACPAAPWDADPEVLGGRDLRAGGSWLSITRGGRFAAVTNIHDGTPPPPDAPSRGLLVSDFVRVGPGAPPRRRAERAPLQYAQDVAKRAAQYAGFHLIVGEAGGEAAYANSAGVWRAIEPGIVALSNAPPEVDWEKTAIARDFLAAALRSPTPVDELLRFLTTPRGGAIEGEVFVTTPLHGTRASTVIAVDAAGAIDFVEQSFSAGGAPAGAAARFRSPSPSSESSPRWRSSD